MSALTVEQSITSERQYRFGVLEGQWIARMPQELRRAGLSHVHDGERATLALFIRKDSIARQRTRGESLPRDESRAVAHLDVMRSGQCLLIVQDRDYLQSTCTGRIPSRVHSAVEWDLPVDDPAQDRDVLRRLRLLAGRKGGRQGMDRARGKVHLA